MSNSELTRIRSDVARLKQRIAEMRAGTRGVRSGPWQEVEGEPGAGVAFSNQLKGYETSLAKLELEYVHAMIPQWGATAIIERMEPHGQKAS